MSVDKATVDGDMVRVEAVFTHKDGSKIQGAHIFKMTEGKWLLLDIDE